MTPRGFLPTYRSNSVNHCPGCGRSHWLVGRISAECAFCQTAIPLLEAGTTGAGMIRRCDRVDLAA